MFRKSCWCVFNLHPFSYELHNYECGKITLHCPHLLSIERLGCWFNDIYSPYSIYEINRYKGSIEWQGSITQLL